MVLQNIWQRTAEQIESVCDYYWMGYRKTDDLCWGIYIKKRGNKYTVISGIYYKPASWRLIEMSNKEATTFIQKVPNLKYRAIKGLFHGL